MSRLYPIAVGSLIAISWLPLVARQQALANVARATSTNAATSDPEAQALASPTTKPTATAMAVEAAATSVSAVVPTLPISPNQ
jgi:hypothetical protein